jgi:hypothetical protein
MGLYSSIAVQQTIKKPDWIDSSPSGHDVLSILRIQQRRLDLRLSQYCRFLWLLTFRTRSRGGIAVKSHAPMLEHGALQPQVHYCPPC